MRTLVVDVADWPVVAAGAPVDVPAAVLQANRVVAASPLARGELVVPGMRRREAQARCPSLVVLEHDPVRDARAFEAVACALDRLCPRIEVLQPGRLAFATHGPSRYWGGDHQLAHRTLATVNAVVGSLCAVGTPVSVGVAGSRFAAQLAAQVVGRQSSAAERALVVDDTVAFLAQLPVSSLGLELSELSDLLVRLGIVTLGQLAGLGRPHLLARFGPSGELAHCLACGEDDRPLEASRPPLDLVAAIEIDPPALAVEQVAFMAKALAEQLHAGLASRGLACSRVAIEVETEHGEQRSRLWRHQGALSAAAMAERVRWQLDGWLNGPVAAAPSAGIALLRLVPDEVMPDRGRQLGFWGGQTEADSEAVRVLSRLGAQLGRSCVLVAESAGGRGPAEQQALVPFDAVDLLGRIDHPALPADRPWPGQLPRPWPMVV
ncbi:MAG: repair protein, partial [Acidimicrobiia bacterium]|nr:repair protein [Acidimicrobiia bacterium]